MFRSFTAVLAVALIVTTVTPAVAQMATPTAAKPVANADKMRCKTTPETGNLAKMHKECHTNA